MVLGAAPLYLHYPLDKSLVICFTLCMGTTTNHKENPMDRNEANTILQQIGRMNLLAISGGRARLEGETLVLPVGQGYRVEIDLICDLYTVRRVFVRAGKKFVKGEVERVYCDQIGEVAYVASCYVNRDFGHKEVGV